MVRDASVNGWKGALQWIERGGSMDGKPLFNGWKMSFPAAGEPCVFSGENS